MTPEPVGIKNKGLVEIECIGRESVSSVRLWHALEAVAGAIESRHTGPNATGVLCDPRHKEGGPWEGGDCARILTYLACRLSLDLV